MIRQCCVCKTIVGEKEPLADVTVTDTYCDPCLSTTLQELHERYGVAATEQASVNEASVM